MAKTDNITRITPSDLELSETELIAPEGSTEWNEALERAYETFMYDLKKSTSDMSNLSEWFASSPSTPKPTPQELG